jgi:hypothetical protein
MVGRAAESVTPQRRGAAIVVVLWALIAVGALASVAALGARVETALAGNYRDHAAALALAEAGLAEALAREAADPGAGAPRELAGTMETGAWSARWTPRAGRYAVRGEGLSGRARREVEAWVDPGPAGPRVVAWREVLR